MLYGEQSREELNVYAENLFRKLIKIRDRRKLYDDVVEKFNMPILTVEQMITFKRDIKEFTTFEVFCVIWFLDRECLSKYFTKSEIDELSHNKFVEDKLSFPLKFSGLVEVAVDQWIGSITAKQLIELRNDGFINYQENQQRAFRVVRYGDVEIYRPFVNNKAVKEIKASMEAGTYIPDPITLNMPEGTEFSFDNGTLIIYSTPTGMVNLLDGYHRTLAISQIMDFNQDFDLTMEIRFVNFSQSKSEAFIFQADQKTQMKKIVSDSYNPNDLGNMICQRLNEDARCNIAGMIGRNEANISLPDMAKLVTYFFIHEKVKKEDRMAFVISVKNMLRNNFNIITEDDPKFLQKYTPERLTIVLYVFSCNDIKTKDYTRYINGIESQITNEDKKLFNIANGIRKRAIKKLENFRKGV